MIQHKYTGDFDTQIPSTVFTKISDEEKSLLQWPLCDERCCRLLPPSCYAIFAGNPRFWNISAIIPLLCASVYEKHITILCRVAKSLARTILVLPISKLSNLF